MRGRAGRVRALGTRHSFHDLADTDGTLITVTGVDPAPVSTRRLRTVEVGAGIRYGDLALWLEERGWALHNMGSLPHISIGGATATGTHGSGDELGNLATAVRGSSTSARTASCIGSRPATRTSTATSSTSAPSASSPRLTLPIEPTFDLRQDVYSRRPVGCRARRPRRRHRLGLQRQRLRALDGRRGGRDPQDPARARASSPTCRRSGAADRGSPAPMIIDADNWTDQGGVAGPWLHRLPHFRLDATPSVGDEIQTEYFVPREHGPAALHAVRALAERIDPHLVDHRAAHDGGGPALAERGLRPRRRSPSTSPGCRIRMPWRLCCPRSRPRSSPSAPGRTGASGTGSTRSAWPPCTRGSTTRATLFERLDPDGVFSNAHLERWLGVRRADSRHDRARPEP